MNTSSSCQLPLIPKETAEIYPIAYDLYQRQEYLAAISWFYLLTALDPLEPKYWKGLGAALQMKQKYEQALDCYEHAQTLNKSQPDPYIYIHAADCHFALKHVKQGLKVLEQAKLRAQSDHKILNHVALMQELWSNR